MQPGDQGRTRPRAATAWLAILATVALATPAHALHQRLASLSFPAGSSPTSSALDAARGLLLVGASAAGGRRS